MTTQSKAQIDWMPFLQAFIILAAGYFVASPALHGTWLWDDDRQVSANMTLRSLHGLWQIWFAPVESDYFPLKSTLLWIQWHLWGGWAVGYRAFSLCCHLLSALILWRLLEKLGLAWGWLGGLIFAVHPLTVESVTWISEIKNTASLPFLLFSMALYVEYDASRKRSVLVWSLVCFLAAMLCKSSGVMLPFVLLLFCWWRHGKIQRRDLMAVAPFFAISLLLGVVTIWFQDSRAIGADEIPAGGPSVAGMAVLFYLWKFLIPIGLSPIYPRWDVHSLLPLVAVAGLVWLFRSLHALLGIGFFLLTLLPVIGFFKMSFMKYSWVSDHFVYLPMIGLIGLTVAAAEWAYRRFRPVKIIVALAVILLMAQAYTHAAVFHDEQAMWQAVLARNPSAWVAYDGLGNVCFEQGRLTEASGMFQRALKIRPDYPKARYNLGCTLAAQGHLSEALDQYRQAPDMAEAHYNMGLVFVRQGLPADAVGQYKNAIALDPNYAEARNNLGVALVRQGHVAEAVEQLQMALKIDPGYQEAYRNLAIAFAAQGKTAEAVATLNLDPGDAKARQLLPVIQNSGHPK